MSLHTNLQSSPLSEQSAVKLTGVTRVLLACGVIGPTLYVIEFLIEGVTRPHYNPWRQWISHLSLSDQGWMNSLGLVLCGVFVLCFAIGLRLVLRSGRGSVFGPLLTACFGLGLILAGIFVIDPGYGYPQGVPASYSLHGMIHTIGATCGIFASLIALCFVLARRFARDPRWKNWTRYSRWTAMVVLLAFLTCSVLASLDQANVLPGAPSGLCERIAFISASLWMVLLALQLLRQRGNQSEDLLSSTEGASQKRAVK